MEVLPSLMVVAASWLLPGWLWASCSWQPCNQRLCGATLCCCFTKLTQKAVEARGTDAVGYFVDSLETVTASAIPARVGIAGNWGDNSSEEFRYSSMWERHVFCYTA